jgi:hypothetical protein
MKTLTLFFILVTVSFTAHAKVVITNGEDILYDGITIKDNILIKGGKLILSNGAKVTGSIYIKDSGSLLIQGEFNSYRKISL